MLLVTWSRWRRNLTKNAHVRLIKMIKILFEKYESDSSFPSRCTEIKSVNPHSHSFSFSLSPLYFSLSSLLLSFPLLHSRSFSCPLSLSCTLFSLSPALSLSLSSLSVTQTQSRGYFCVLSFVILKTGVILP